MPDASLDANTLRITRIFDATRVRVFDVEVKRPERLSFTWAHHADGDFAKPRGHETVVRIKFRAMGNKTEMALVHGAFTDGYAEHSRGWDGSFDKLETFLRRAA